MLAHLYYASHPSPFHSQKPYINVGILAYSGHDPSSRHRHGLQPHPLPVRSSRLLVRLVYHWLICCQNQ